MDLGKDLDKLKSDIEGGIKKAESDIADKGSNVAIEEAVKTLAKKGINTDDIMAQIQEKFSNVDVNKLKEIVEKVLKKEEK